MSEHATQSAFSLPQRLRELAGEATNEPAMVVRHAADEIDRLNEVITRLRYGLNDLQTKVERQWPAKSDNVRASLKIAEEILKETIADGAF